MITQFKQQLSKPNHILKLAYLFFAGALAGCSPVNLLNGLVPTDGHTLTPNIAYGELARQKLDIYIPTNKTTSNNKKLMPIVLFIYGGSWDSGEKKDYLFAAEAFTSKGYLTVIPDYRLFPEVKFPAFIDDAALASKWVKSHIAEYGGDPDQIFIVGHSAGAQIGLMLDLNTEYLARVNLKPDAFKGYIGLAGPYDFLPLKSQRLKDIFGPEELRWKSQPINYVTGKNQPTLLLVGLKDDIVWPKNTFNLAKAIEAKKGPVKVVKFPDYGHVDMVTNIAKPFRGNSTLLDEIILFMRNN